MNTIRKIFDLLSPRERRNLYFLFGAVLIMAALEVASVASIMPFLSVAANPESVHENTYLNWAFEAFNFTEIQSFLIGLGLVALAALVASNVFITLVIWLQYRYVWNRNHSISKRLLKRYLQHPYEYFLTHNSANLSKNILEEAKEVSTQLLQPALQGIAKGIVALAIICFLIFIEPFVALGVAIVLGGAYGGIFLIVRRKLEEIGRKRVQANRGRYQSVSEAFGGIKEVKLRGKESIFLSQFDRPSKEYARYQTLNTLINKGPRYLLEAVAFGGVIVIAIYLIAVQDNIRQVIPMLGLYAFAGYRLMPALQRSFKGFAMARFNKEALETLHRDLFETSPRATPEMGTEWSSNGAEMNHQRRIELTDNLQVENVTFTYPEAQQPAISVLSLEIEARSTVGFVGKTGSGKTTAVDIILGLLRPQKGTICIDGERLHNSNLRAWQQTVGYVPQHIYLSDDTVARNVAFGVPEDKIDYERVEEVARMAQVRDFIVSEMPNGFDTIVGERGVKLSGGQKQRIGIARALYHAPSVLVFDEATSALDQVTEARVMDAIRGLAGKHTIILIAHRLSTVSQAQKIFMLSEGQLIGSGTYEELLEQNKAFQEIAHA